MNWSHQVSVQSFLIWMATWSCSGVFDIWWFSFLSLGKDPKPKQLSRWSDSKPKRRYMALPLLSGRRSLSSRDGIWKNLIYDRSVADALMTDNHFMPVEFFAYEIAVSSRLASVIFFFFTRSSSWYKTFCLFHCKSTKLRRSNVR